MVLVCIGAFLILASLLPGRFNESFLEPDQIHSGFTGSGSDEMLDDVCSLAQADDIELNGTMLLSRRIEALAGTTCRSRHNISQVAYAIVYDLFEDVEKLPARNEQIKRAFKMLRRTKTEASLLLVMPEVSGLKPRIVADGLESLDVTVVKAGWPIRQHQLNPYHAAFLKRNPNCCGWREFYKLALWKLTDYSRILLLDSDIQVLANVDHLLQCSHDSFTATPGFQSPVNGGFWILKPSLCTYRSMLKLVLNGNYTNQNHWGNLGLQKMHVGAEGPQGFIYYYFYILPAVDKSRWNHQGRGRFIDKCIFNANLHFCNKKNTFGGTTHIVHKPKVPLLPGQVAQLVGRTHLPMKHNEPEDDNRTDILLLVSFADIRNTIMCTFGRTVTGLTQEISPKLRFHESSSLHGLLKNENAWPTPDGLKYALIVSRPFLRVAEAFAFCDATLIGAQGNLEAKIQEGTATVDDYLNAPDSEFVANPTVVMISGSENVNVSNVDLRIAMTRLYGLEMLIGLADRITESIQLWNYHLEAKVKTVQACSPSNDTLRRKATMVASSFNKSQIQAINARSMLDFKLYSTARGVFRTQYYRAFGKILPEFENLTSSSALKCNPKSLSCGNSTIGLSNATKREDPTASARLNVCWQECQANPMRVF